MVKYLDDTGLTYLWEKIKSLFATKEEVEEALTERIPQYVLCTLPEYNAMESHDENTFYIIIA